MESFPTVKQDQSVVRSAYLHNAEGVIAALSSALGADLLSRFHDYRAFLRSARKHAANNRRWRQIFGDRADVVTEGNGNAFADFLFTTHLAACCEMLNGLAVPQNNLTREAFAATLTNLEVLSDGRGTTLEDEINVRFHSMDAVRTIQILRYLGLVTRNTEHFKQLSLGAGSGIKDIRSLHLIPHIRRAEYDAAGGRKDFALFFETQLGYVQDIVVTDGDPQHVPYYEELRQLKEPKVLAFNDELNDTLSYLPKALENSQWEKRNLVVALRIDYRMFPDLESFFRRIAPVIDDGADLIISIGSGHNIEEFAGRMQKIDELNEFLKGLGMHPLRIRMHKGTSLEEQQKRNLFGISGSTTYEIVHCKLMKSRLKRLRAVDS